MVRQVGSVRNAALILRFVARQPRPSGVNLIARETNISVSSCFGILRTLTDERLVRFDPATKTYAPGLGLVDLAVPLLGANPIELMRHELESLARTHECLVCLWQFTPDERIVLVNRACDSETVRVDMTVGARLPAYAGAVGRCYAGLSGLPPSRLRRAFARVSWQRPPHFEDYMADAGASRQTGVAFDFGRLFRGLEIAAALVTDADGRARYGISGIAISGQMTRPRVHRMAGELHAAAQRIGGAVFALPPALSAAEPEEVSGRAIGAAAPPRRRRKDP